MPVSNGEALWFKWKQTVGLFCGVWLPLEMAESGGPFGKTVQREHVLVAARKVRKAKLGHVTPPERHSELNELPFRYYSFLGL